METFNMRVIKRNGELEEIAFDKILNRIKKLGMEANINVNYSSLTMKVIDQLYDKIHTTKIDELTADHCISLSTHHPDYATLAGRILVSNHQKNTSPSFSEAMKQLYYFYDVHEGHSPIISQELWEMVSSNREIFDEMINHNRDYLIDFFGFKTLERAYLYKINNTIVERPQYMWLRVAIGIHGKKMDDIKETYDLMSQKYFTHATPTLFNAGSPRPQLSSCFLQAMENDSVDGIYNTLKECAQISKYSGGIGLHIHNIRCKDSHIRGTNGKTAGIVPMLKVFNNTARYINQCFAPETVVYSKDGPKQMKDITTSDELITMDGTFKRVNKIIINKVKKEILEIETANSLFPVRVTKEHEIYVINHETQNKAGQFMPSFLSAGNLKEDDLVAFPIPSYVNETYVISNMNFYESYGTLIGNQEEKMPSPYLHLSQEKTLKLIIGIFKSSNFNTQKNTYSSTNSLLISQIKYLLLKLGVLTTSSHEFEITVPEEYQLQVKTTSNSNNILWSPITKITKIEYEGDVYDFNMIDNHNYLTDMGLVHNSGKRNGSFAIYLEPWHGDIESFLEMRKNHGDEEMKARDLFYALWVPDLFMERIKENKKWSLFCPDECPGLSDVYGNKFKELYESYESSGKARKTMDARDLWFKVLDAQMETGTPYLLYKDAANMKSNQKNIGTIKSSNLCTEIIQVSDEKETSVCNLASIGLPTCVNTTTLEFDYDKLHAVTKVITNNLNKIIDINYYPTPKSKRSNLLNRPIGIGVQGLADVFMMMNVPFHSDAAKKINIDIFETIYHAALEKSNEIAIDRHDKLKRFHDYFNEMKTLQTNTAEDYVTTDTIFEHLSELKPIYGEMNNLSNERCGAYSSFEGSPASLGYLQFDMWNVIPLSNRYDWTGLKQSIRKYGLRNSLLLAPMPTASTSQILGFNECFEPITSNIYSRSTLAGEFILANKYLMNDLIQLGLWTEKIKDNIIANKGSIQQLTVLPQYIRDKYKIVWEIPMKHIIDMSADRGAYVCQSQSLNLWLEDPNYNTLTSMHFYSWKKGLKTGIYYLRRKAKHCAQQFSIEPERKQEDKNTQHDEICEMCSA
jgi:ribonucleotide reductase alpha subunit